MKISYLYKSGNVWTISNFLSAIRIPFSILIYVFIKNEQVLAASLIAILAIISDYADGYFARKRNEISELGKVLDPIGDKLTVSLGSIALHQTYGLPLWIVVVIISRDILILFGSLILIQKAEQVVASEIPGKIAVTVISFLLLSYLFDVYILQTPLLYLAFLSVLVSFYYYMKKFLNFFK